MSILITSGLSIELGKNRNILLIISDYLQILCSQVMFHVYVVINWYTTAHDLVLFFFSFKFNLARKCQYKCNLEFSPVLICQLTAFIANSAMILKVYFGF